MKVKDCEKCKHYQRILWSHSYAPADYHNIGMSHAYGYCRLNNRRCLNVKKAQCQKEAK